MNSEIYKIDQKLIDLRKRWALGSPAMKKYIEIGAKLLKEKRERLIKTGENR